MHPFYHVAVVYCVLYTLFNHVDAFDTSFFHRFFYKPVDEPTNGERPKRNDEPMEIILLHNETADPPVCDDNKLMMRLANFQFISPERILLMLLTEHKVDMCHKLKTSIADTRNEMEHCSPFGEENLYWRLFQGMVELHRKACDTESGSTKVLEDQELCIRDMREDFIDCEGPAAWFERNDQSIVCQIFEDILQCEFIKSGELCGLHIAQVLRCFATDVFNAALLRPCNTTIQPPNIPYPMPIDCGTTQMQSKNWMFICCIELIFTVIPFAIDI